MVVDGKEYDFHLLPSGIINTKAVSFIGECLHPGAPQPRANVGAGPRLSAQPAQQGPAQVPVTPGALAECLTGEPAFSLSDGVGWGGGGQDSASLARGREGAGSLSSPTPQVLSKPMCMCGRVCVCMCVCTHACP